jgi:hypothetical protein
MMAPSVALALAAQLCGEVDAVPPRADAGAGVTRHSGSEEPEAPSPVIVAIPRLLAPAPRPPSGGRGPRAAARLRGTLSAP